MENEPINLIGCDTIVNSPSLNPTRLNMEDSKKFKWKMTKPFL